MTCVIAGVGLLPAAMSTGIGSQVQKPLAIVVVSGMTLAPDSDSNCSSRINSHCSAASARRTALSATS